MKEDEELQAAFDKSFKEAPAKMWAEFEKNNKAMREDFMRGYNNMEKRFDEHDKAFRRSTKSS
jgi:hypothetical protein